MGSLKLEAGTYASTNTSNPTKSRAARQQPAQTDSTPQARPPARLGPFARTPRPAGHSSHTACRPAALIDSGVCTACLPPHGIQPPSTLTSGSTLASPGASCSRQARSSSQLQERATSPHPTSQVALPWPHQPSELTGRFSGHTPSPRRRQQLRPPAGTMRLSIKRAEAERMEEQGERAGGQAATAARAGGSRSPASPG